LFAVLCGILAGILAISAGTSGCMDSDGGGSPTAPVAKSQESDSSATLPDRMSIVIVRRGTHTPTRTSTSRPTATFTATLTAAATFTPEPSGTSAPTFTPTPTKPSRTPTATRTRTPTPASTVAIALRGIPFQWDFFSVPGQSDGGSAATLHRGQSYQMTVFNNAPSDSNPHFFSGVAPLGISGGVLGAGDSFVVTFTPSSLGNFLFSCTDSTCGVGHADMVGSITVVP
jgi:hypothetical protein